MKKKILISLVACLIAAGSFVHYKFAENNHNMDFSLADFSVMAQAEGETNPKCPNGCLTKAGHCWCYAYYPYEEKVWP